MLFLIGFADFMLGMVLGCYMPWWMALIICLVIFASACIILAVASERRDDQAFYALADESYDHPDNCECNGCYETGRGAWAPGGFMNPSPA
jgi:hypothetical protein